jgi:hypothetical protein
MKRILPYWWMILTGCIFTLMPLGAKEINIGEHVISKAQAIESGMFYILGALSLLLFISVFLSIHNNIKGNLIVKIWGVIYSLILIPFAYVQFGILNIMLIAIMAGYSAAWYYGASKIITGKNA